MKKIDTSEFRIQLSLITETIRNILAPAIARYGLLDEALEALKRAAWRWVGHFSGDRKVSRKIAANHVDRQEKRTYLVESRQAGGETVSEEQAALSYRTRETVINFFAQHYTESFTPGDVARALGGRLRHLQRRDFEPLLKLYAGLGHLIQEENRFRARGPAIWIKTEDLAQRRAKLGRNFRKIMPLSESYLKGDARLITFQAKLPPDLWEKLGERLTQEVPRIVADLAEESNEPHRRKEEEIEGSGFFLVGRGSWPYPPDGEEEAHGEAEAPDSPPAPPRDACSGLPTIIRGRFAAPRCFFYRKEVITMLAAWSVIETIIEVLKHLFG